MFIENVNGSRRDFRACVHRGKAFDNLKRAGGDRIALADAHRRLCSDAGLYTATLIVFLFLLCILACFPVFEQYLKNRSNHFEIHLELKSSEYLRDFVTVSRRLGLRIDDMEANQAYAGSGLSVFTVTFTICSAELKKYKTHREIIEALSSLDYIYHIEEMR